MLCPVSQVRQLHLLPANLQLLNDPENLKILATLPVLERRTEPRVEGCLLFLSQSALGTSAQNNLNLVYLIGFFFLQKSFPSP